MPTDADFEELFDNTTATWTQQGGVNGWLFTANNGSGNSLFLPAAGYRSGDELVDAGGWGYYWSSSLDTDAPRLAWNIEFNSGNYYVISHYRFDGFTVRPVREN